MPNRKRESKKFVFPENVNSSYGVFLGLSLKELAVYVLPVLLVGVILFIIPPYTIKPILTKATVLIILLTIVLDVVSSRPVAYRNNIKLVQHMQMKRNYKNRQHLFFKERNKRG